MRLAYSLAILIVIPVVAVWAAGVAIFTAIDEGTKLLGDVWT